MFLDPHPPEIRGKPSNGTAYISHARRNATSNADWKWNVIRFPPNLLGNLIIVRVCVCPGERAHLVYCLATHAWHVTDTFGGHRQMKANRRQKTNDCIYFSDIFHFGSFECVEYPHRVPCAHAPRPYSNANFNPPAFHFTLFFFFY